MFHFGVSFDTGSRKELPTSYFELHHLHHHTYHDVHHHINHLHDHIHHHAHDDIHQIQHLGLAERGSAWLAIHPPSEHYLSIISVIIFLIVMVVVVMVMVMVVNCLKELQHSWNNWWQLESRWYQKLGKCSDNNNSYQGFLILSTSVSILPSFPKIGNWWSDLNNGRYDCMIISYDHNDTWYTHIWCLEVVMDDKEFHKTIHSSGIQADGYSMMVREWI